MLEIKFWKENKNLLDARNPFPQTGQRDNRLQNFFPLGNFFLTFSFGRWESTPIPVVGRFLVQWGLGSGWEKGSEAIQLSVSK